MAAGLSPAHLSYLILPRLPLLSPHPLSLQQKKRKKKARPGSGVVTNAWTKPVVWKAPTASPAPRGIGQSVRSRITSILPSGARSPEYRQTCENEVSHLPTHPGFCHLFFNFSDLLNKVRLCCK